MRLELSGGERQGLHHIAALLEVLAARVGAGGEYRGPVLELEPRDLIASASLLRRLATRAGRSRSRQR